MHIDIEFSTDTNAELSDALMETKMSSFFIKDVITTDPSFATITPSINRIPNNIQSLFIYRSPDNREFFTNPDTQTIEVPPNLISLAASNEIVGFEASNAKGQIPETIDKSFFFGDKVEISGNIPPSGEVDRVFAYRDSGGNVIFYENIADGQSIQSYDSNTA